MREQRDFLFGITSGKRGFLGVTISWMHGNFGVWQLEFCQHPMSTKGSVCAGAPQFNFSHGEPPLSRLVAVIDRNGNNAPNPRR